MKPLVNKQHERGTALIGVILALLVVTIVGVAITLLGMVNVTTGTNERQGSESFYLADAGIAQAERLFRARASSDLDTILQSGNGVACDGDELAAPPAPPSPITAADTIETIANGGEVFAPAGRYQVRVCDDHATEMAAAPDPPDLPNLNPNEDRNDRVRIVSTGFGRDNSMATIEMFVTARPLPGVLVDGPARVNGNPRLMGDIGAIHANGTLELPGTPCAEQYFSSSAAIVGDGQGGAACTNGQADYRPGSEPIEVPSFNPADFLPLATYRMNAQTCAVTNAAGALLNDPATKKWGNWDCDPGGQRWVFGAGAGFPNGTYYSTGNIGISGSPGTVAVPISATFISQGWIDISGNPNMVPSLSVNGVNYSAIAGTDLKIAGNPLTLAYSGVMYARDQIGFSGNPSLSTQVISDNQGDLPFPNPGGTNLLPRLAGGFVEISGNPTINSGGAGGIVQVGINSWRECRGVNLADPCL
jgi:hypothetical protein